MIRRPRYDAPPKLQEGMVDPHINETVTHVAELDVEAFRRQRQQILCILLIPAIMGICFPCMWIVVCLMYKSFKDQTEATIRGSQVYLTEHTLVGTMGNQPIESSRVTIPLANIASVTVQPRVMIVNIKPTAPEVMLNRHHVHGGHQGSAHDRYTSTVATRSVPLYGVKNAEAFAEIIQSNIS